MMNYQGQPCRNCGEIISVYSLSGLCRNCWRSRVKTKKYCSCCGKSITPYSRTGFCIDCYYVSRKRDINKYHLVRVNGVQMPEHRYIWELHYGKIPEGFVVHHLNKLKGDNRIENLVIMPAGHHWSMHGVETKQNH